MDNMDSKDKQAAVKRLFEMFRHQHAAERMSDAQLIDEIAKIDPGIDTLGGAVITEIIHRWQHPIRWRWERMKTKCLTRLKFLRGAKRTANPANITR